MKIKFGIPKAQCSQAGPASVNSHSDPRRSSTRSRSMHCARVRRLLARWCLGPIMRTCSHDTDLSLLPDWIHICEDVKSKRSRLTPTVINLSTLPASHRTSHYTPIPQRLSSGRRAGSPGSEIPCPHTYPALNNTYELQVYSRQLD